MLVLEAGNIKKYYRDKLIIEFDDLKIYSGDKIGIVGQNGSGKTTLLNILSLDIEPDQGFVKHYCDISYIRQFSDKKIKDVNPKDLKEFNLNNKTHQEVYSGGEETRIKIVNAFKNESLLLFADEPTANLDYKGIELLKQKLSEVETFLLVSHDRALLDSLCNKILEVRDSKIKIYIGNYSSYKEQKDRELQYEMLEYNKYVSEKSKLEEAIMDRQNRSKTMRKTPKRMGNSEARLHKMDAQQKQKKLDSSVNSLKTRLEKLEVKERPKEIPKIKLDFSLTDPPKNKVVISSEGLTFSYGSKKIFDSAQFKVYNGSKTALWGENGAGKTTLLNLIANTTNDSVYIVPKAKLGYFRQGFENLDYDKTILENVMKDSVQSQTVARTILARLLISGEDVYKRVGVLSGGERIKVSFAKLFVSDANVLLMDEPTNYLDMQSIEALEDVLREYEGTVLFVSHDREFVNAVADRLLIVENRQIVEFEGTPKEYFDGGKKSIISNNSEAERIALQMRIAEVVARLSEPGADKERLEEEYRYLIRQLK